MNALRLHGRHDLRLHREDAPTSALGEALVRVTAVGICGSDLHWFSEAGIGDAQLAEHPLVLGHEAAGVIQSGPRQGERVAIDPTVACGECTFCREGNPHFCEHLSFAGYGSTDGFLREQIAWRERCLHPLPDTLSDPEGAMLEPLGVAIHAHDLSKMRLGMRVGVFGCGPIGLLLIQLARLSGATQIIATDRLPHRLEAARHCGATEVFQSFHGEENEAIWAATRHEGVHVAFESAGENEAVETAIASARRGGKVILVGIPSDDRTAFRASTARQKGLTIKLCRRMRNSYPRAIHLVATGQVEVRSLVTHRFSLDRYQQAFQVAEKREGLKVIIEP
jgi:L-iditol 2-dehydrogenase